VRRTVADDRLFLRNVIWFGSMHLLPLGALFTGAPASVWSAAAILYWVRIWFVTAGYHCYFSHRSFKTGRAFQFVLALGAATSGQGSALRWAAAHRYHHAYSDRDLDLHSPVKRSFWYAHMGWLFNTRYLAPSEPRSGPFVRYPELVWLDRHSNVPTFTLMGATLLLWGLPGLFIAFGLSTILVYHATFTVNSLAHVFGSRRYPTTDDSRNNWFVALIMLGGGWHNNHHRYPQSARQGIKWWEWDPTYYALVALSWVGIVWDIRVQKEPALVRATAASR
jgi:stearoyl-CoA desaturase (delta-9 desaturase)